MELVGRVAYVWVALDEPGTIDQIIERLDEVAPPSGIRTACQSDRNVLANDVQLLVGAGVVEVVQIPIASDDGAGQ